MKRRKKDLTPKEKRVAEMKEFIEHLMAFVVVNGALFILNIITSPTSLWFLWVAFAWGIGLVFHAVDVFMGDGSGLAQRVVDRMDRVTGKTEDDEDAAPARATVIPEKAPSLSEIGGIVDSGTAVVDKMRRDVRIIPQGQARRDAMQLVNRADEILMAIEERPEEVLLARDFLNGLLIPVGKLLGDYARLAARDVPAARPTLREVEENDLPALQRRMDAVYERLHRGSLIDLEVAREMMALDTPIQTARVN